MHKRGLALIELLLVMAIMITVMTLIAQYLSGQRELTMRTQARSEVQNRVRMVMQLVSQDLQLVGSSILIDPTDGDILTDVSLPCNNIGCLTAANSAAQDTFSAQYIGKLWFDSAVTGTHDETCRSVEYSFNSTSPTTLLRSDVTCANAGTPVPVKLAQNILALDIQYQCSDTGVSNTPSCANSYPRSAKVTVIGQSRYALNHAPASSFTTPSAETISCATNHICVAVTQEVVMPNVKN